MRSSTVGKLLQLVSLDDAEEIDERNLSRLRRGHERSLLVGVGQHYKSTHLSGVLEVTQVPFLGIAVIRLFGSRLSSNVSRTEALRGDLLISIGAVVSMFFCGGHY